MGIQLIAKGEFSDKYLICSFICSGPVAQFSPRISILNGSSIVNAEAMSDPTSIVPVVSIVIDTIIGISKFLLLSTSFDANKADLICNTSWQVSIKRRSTPPSIRPYICYLYDCFNSSKSICPNVGNLVVGPIEPATNLGLLTDAYLEAAFFAISAAFLFISYALSAILYS